MNTVARIHGLVSQVEGGISTELLEDLCSVHPAGRTGNQRHAFELNLPREDDRTLRVLSLLAKAGYRPWEDQTRLPISGEEFSFQLERVYDDNDLSTCELLELCPMGKMYVRGEGRIAGRVIAQMVRPGKAAISLLSLTSSTYIAVQRARDALEAANLVGLQFLPVEKTYESVDYDLFDEEDTWWELESDIELPPLAPSMTLETRDGRPFAGDFSEGCVRRDGFYTYPELHYRRADLERIAPFDAARTFEQFHPRGPAPRSRAFVVSQKFYQVCRDNGITTRFVPVRIDD